MQKRLLSSILFLSAFFLLINPTSAGTKCTGYDITFNSVTITGVTTSEVYYNYTIENLGTLDMDYNKIVLQNYLSADMVFGAGDQAAGGSIITSGAGAVVAGTTYSSQFQANHTNDLGTFFYLIVQLSYTNGECDVANNQIVICLKPDVQFTSFTITDTQSGYIDYDFTIKNVGGDTLFFDELTLENYLSTDASFGGDVAAGGTLLTFDGADYLLANQTYTTSYTANGAIASYSYLFTNLTYTGISECNLGNNQAMDPIPAIAGIMNPSNASENNFIIWNIDRKSFTVNQWSTQLSSGPLEYKLYNTAGILQISGSTYLGETTMINANAGIYLLVVSDGQKMYSKKILY